MRSLQLRLPIDKLEHLLLELERVSEEKVISHRELQSLTGLLQHASKMVKPGRAFPHCLYVLQAMGQSPHHHIHLNVPARTDIMWWQVFYWVQWTITTEYQARGAPHYHILLCSCHPPEVASASMDRREDHLSHS